MTHRSWSQLTSYAKCGKQYELTRIHHAPEKPAWYLVGGKAFHAAIEYVNYGGPLDTHDDVWAFYWDQEYQAALDATDVPPEQWRTAGRKTKDKPNGEDGAWWNSAGPGMLWDYAIWLDGMEDQGWEIADLGPSMGIELEMNSLFPNLLDEHRFNILVKAYLDVLFVKGTDYLVVDAKTGSKPDSPAQLGQYACSLELLNLPRPRWGAYYMARTGESTPPEDLDRFTVDLFAQQYGQLEQGIMAGVFLPNLGRMCGSCGVNRYCAAYGGDLAAGYDPLAIATSHRKDTT